jgi:hypothetical protein
MSMAMLVWLGVLAVANTVLMVKAIIDFRRR